jgi:hypothetical protein
LPFNTILMLRTYRKANDSPSSPLSQQSILATALPDQVRFFLLLSLIAHFVVGFLHMLVRYRAGPVLYAAC